MPKLPGINNEICCYMKMMLLNVFRQVRVMRIEHVPTELKGTESLSIPSLCISESYIKAFIKPFETPQRSTKIKVQINFLSSSGIRTGRVKSTMSKVPVHRHFGDLVNKVYFMNIGVIFNY